MAKNLHANVLNFQCSDCSLIHKPAAAYSFIFIFQSASTIGLVKRDLAEFTSTMHDDTVMAATVVREKLTVSCNSVCILHQYQFHPSDNN